MRRASPQCEQALERHLQRCAARTATVAKAARRNLKKEREIAFLESGGELNPGPPPHAGGPKQPRVRSGPQNRLTIQRANTAPVTTREVRAFESLIHAELTAATEKQQARDDAGKEQAEEQARLKAEAASSEFLAAVNRRSELFTELLSDLRGLAFHPILPDCNVREWAEVGRSRANLTQFCFPHRVCVVEEIQVVPVSSLDEKGKVVHDVEQLPKEAELCDKSDAYAIAVRVSTESMGWFGRKCGFSTAVFTISYDQFLTFRSRRLASFNMASALDRVMSFRARNPCFVQNSRTMQQNDILNDNVFAALAIVSGRDLTQGFGLWGDLVAKELSKHLFRVFTSADHPAAGGTYVVGYNTDVALIWPKEFAEALDRVSLVGARQASHELAERLVAKGVTISESMTKIRANVVVAGEKALGYCRQAPVAIRGLVPAFPNPHDAKNALVGMVKRLLRPTSEATPEAQAREEAAADVLCELVQDPCLDEEDEVLDVEDHLSSKGAGWSEADKDEFRRGAEFVARVQEDFALWGEMEVEVQNSIARFNAFIKSESYDPDACKATRNIICPSFFLRGVLWAAYARPAERIFHAVDRHCVKHMTPQESAKVTDEDFHGKGGGETVVHQTDGKSFESLVGRRRRGLETRVFMAAAAQKSRLLIERLGALFSEQWEVTQDVWRASLPSIRRSGEYVTSAGNFVANFCINLGAVTRASGVSVAHGLEEARASIRRYVSSHAWRFEGDDGIVEMAKSIFERLPAAYREAGVEMTNLANEEVAELEFCGQKMVDTPLGPVVYKEPLDLVARATHWIGCDAHSNRADEEMEVSRCVSYHLAFGHLPLIGHFTSSFLETHEAQVNKLLDAASSAGQRVSMAARDLRSRVNAQLRNWGSSAPVKIDLAAARVRSSLRNAPELLDRVAEELRLPVSTIKDWAARIEEGVRSRTSVIDIPDLESFWTQMAGVKRMTQVKVADAREVVQAEADRLATLARAKYAVAKTEMLGRVSAIVQAGTVSAGMVAAATGAVGLWGGVCVLGVTATAAAGAYLWCTLLLAWPSKLVRGMIALAAHVVTAFVVAGWISTFRVAWSTVESARDVSSRVSAMVSEVGERTLKFWRRHGISSLFSVHCSLFGWGKK